MPIKSRTNNQLIPTNRRSVDVAKSTIDRLIPHQNLRYDSAFQVQGFQCVLYSKLTQGKPCLCKSKNKVLSSVLDDQGNADPGVLNSMLTGQEFGLLPYGVKPSAPLVADSFVIETGGPAAELELPSIYDVDSGSRRAGKTGGPGGNYLNSTNHLDTTNVPDGYSDSGPVFSDEEGGALEKLQLLTSNNYDNFSLGLTDVACPICFGSGVVGGYSVYNGFRKVLDSQELESSVTVYHDEFVPLIEPEAGQRIAFEPFILPMSQNIDSFKIFNGKSIVKGKIFCNDTELRDEHQLLPFCRGHAVVIAVELQDTGSCFTHVEIQTNQSDKYALFEFPKLSQSEAEELIERTEPFQLILPPSLPNLKNGDIIIDSSYGKVLQITNSSWWNDKRRAVLGWECSVRPTQPQEVFSILPKRRKLEAVNRPAYNRPNLDKKF